MNTIDNESSFFKCQPGDTGKGVIVVDQSEIYGTWRPTSDLGSRTLTLEQEKNWPEIARSAVKEQWRVEFTKEERFGGKKYKNIGVVTGRDGESLVIQYVAHDDSAGRFIVSPEIFVANFTKTELYPELSVSVDNGKPPEA